MISHTGVWVTLIVLGYYHGINPAMGWLFAVSQGLQHRSRRALLRSLVPIAIGHELSIAIVAVIVLGASAAVPSAALHMGAAVVLFAFGVFRFVKPRAHWRWTTMRVSDRELAVWSFLMSTAHGAGLMVAPVLIGLQGVGEASVNARAGDSQDVGMLSHVPLLPSGIGIALHVLTMISVAGVIALLVYEKLGLEVLRRAWLNTDRVWALAFFIAAAVTLITS
ncbi:MAG: hypothetical protein JO168_09430 [Solirubrobacterales bacterium]|nr:hypothetical protein [Solirubrobacterales bacterium]MBV9714192.1 hypothetical protein [Solirubrobacterales bacterium]